jgi:hypothetical protein
MVWKIGQEAPKDEIFGCCVERGADEDEDVLCDV